MDRNNIIAFALSMLVFAGYLAYQQQRETDVLAGEGSSATIVVADDGLGTAPANSGATGDELARPNSSPDALAASNSAEAAVDPKTARTAGVESSAGDPAGAQSAAPLAREIPLEVHTLENTEIVARISNAPEMIQGWGLVHYDERLPSEWRHLSRG